MVGMKHVVNNIEHRKEFIAGNLSEFMTKGASVRIYSRSRAALTP